MSQPFFSSAESPHRSVAVPSVQDCFFFLGLKNPPWAARRQEQSSGGGAFSFLLLLIWISPRHRFAPSPLLHFLLLLLLLLPYLHISWAFSIGAGGRPSCSALSPLHPSALVFIAILILLSLSTIPFSPRLSAGQVAIGQDCEPPPYVPPKRVCELAVCALCALAAGTMSTRAPPPPDG